MKAITIKQPWATLIALGEKRFETRGWQTKHRGQLAIHAGKKVDREACEITEIKAALARHGYTADNLPTGAVVAMCELKECWSIGIDYQSGMAELHNGTIVHSRDVGLKEEKFGWYDDGRYAWELGDVQALPQPIPTKGQLSLWEWEGLQ